MFFQMKLKLIWYYISRCDTSAMATVTMRGEASSSVELSRFHFQLITNLGPFRINVQPKVLIFFRILATGAFFQEQKSCCEHSEWYISNGATGTKAWSWILGRN